MLIYVLLATSCGSGPDAGWRLGEVGQSCWDACKSDGERVCWAFRQLEWKDRLGDDNAANVALIQSMSGLFGEVTAVEADVDTPKDWPSAPLVKVGYNKFVPPKPGPAGAGGSTPDPGVSACLADNTTEGGNGGFFADFRRLCCCVAAVPGDDQSEEERKALERTNKETCPFPTVESNMDCTTPDTYFNLNKVRCMFPTPGWKLGHPFVPPNLAQTCEALCENQGCTPSRTRNDLIGKNLSMNGLLLSAEDPQAPTPHKPHLCKTAEPAADTISALTPYVVGSGVSDGSCYFPSELGGGGTWQSNTAEASTLALGGLYPGKKLRRICCCATSVSSELRNAGGSTPEKAECPLENNDCEGAGVEFIPKLGECGQPTPVIDSDRPTGWYVGDEDRASCDQICFDEKGLTQKDVACDANRMEQLSASGQTQANVETAVRNAMRAANFLRANRSLSELECDSYHVPPNVGIPGGGGWGGKRYWLPMVEWPAKTCWLPMGSLDVPKCGESVDLPFEISKSFRRLCCCVASSEGEVAQTMCPFSASDCILPLNHYHEDTGICSRVPPPTARPTAAPTTKPTVPTAAPTTAPTVPTAALTTAPTVSTPLKDLLTLSVTPLVVLEAATTARDLFTVNPATFNSGGVLDGAAGETVAVACQVSDGSASALRVAEPSAITIDASGVVTPPGASIAVHGVLDAMNLESRDATVQCTITASGGTTAAETFTQRVAVGGIAQPSVRLFCSANETADAAGSIAELSSCAPTITTNGGNRVIVIGGSCGTCPAPQFTERTVVSVAGILCVVVLVPGTNGSRLEFMLPSVAAMEAVTSVPTLAPTASPSAVALERRRRRLGSPFSFGWDRYYPLRITTTWLQPSIGVEGSIELGTGAETVDSSGQLACAAKGYCPPGTAATSGVFFTQLCDGFADPSTDVRWASDDPALRRLFALGFPPRCRPCPDGCKCPGGERCQTIPGYFSTMVVGTSGGDATPVRCSPPALVRCTGYDAALGTTRCGVGYDQTTIGCEVCGRGYYKDIGGTCTQCPSSDLMGAYLLPAALNFGTVSLLFPLLALAKFTILAISLACEMEETKVELGKAETTSKWAIAKGVIMVAGKETLLQTAQFVLSTFGAVQLVATVNNAASGVAPPAFKQLSTALRTFLFIPPMVRAECVVDGFDAGLYPDIAILIIGLLLVLFDGMGHVRWLRLEQVVFGWRCCHNKRDPVRKVALVLRDTITPFLRYGISTLLSMGYVKVTETALDMLACVQPVLGDGSTLALVRDPETTCFEGEHTAAFILALLAISLVSVIWPIANLVRMVKRFAMPRAEQKKEEGETGSDGKSDASFESCMSTKKLCLQCCDVVESDANEEDELDGRSAASPSSLDISLVPNEPSALGDEEAEGEEPDSGSVKVSVRAGQRRTSTGFASLHITAAAYVPNSGESSVSVSTSTQRKSELEVALERQLDGPLRMHACRRTLAAIALELGCVARRNDTAKQRLRDDEWTRPTVVNARLAAMGESRARAYFSFVDTPFEAQYFWLVAVRHYTMFVLALLNVINAMTANVPTVTSAVLLCILTTITMIVFSTITLMWCPYHHADRWNGVEAAAVLFLTVLGAGTNMFISFSELEIEGARSVAGHLAFISAVLLPLCLTAMIITFLFTRGLGCCRRLGCTCVRHCDSRGARFTGHIEDDGTLLGGRAHEASSPLTQQEGERGAPPRVTSIQRVTSAVIGGHRPTLNFDESKHTGSFARNRQKSLAMRSNPLAENLAMTGTGDFLGTIGFLPPAAPRVEHEVEMVDFEASPFTAAATASGGENEGGLSSRSPSRIEAIKLRGRSLMRSISLKQPVQGGDEAAVPTIRKRRTPSRRSPSRSESIKSRGRSLVTRISKVFSREPSQQQGALALHLDEHLDEAESCAPLPPGWDEHVDESSGASYFHHEEDGVTTWQRPPPTVAPPLPDGWIEHVNTESGLPYFHHETTSTSTYDRPTTEEEESLVLGEDEPTAPDAAADSAAIQIETPPSAAAEDREAAAAVVIQTTSQQKGRGSKVVQQLRPERKVRRYVRWKYTPRDGTTLADALLNGVDSNDGDDAPLYLDTLFKSLFQKADRDHDGALTTIELMHMLQARAKGTALNGDAHAIFSLRTLMEESAMEGSEGGGEAVISSREFGTGLIEAVRRDPDGAVARWILKELQDEAEQWEELGEEEESAEEVVGGRPSSLTALWRHRGSGEMVDVRPTLLVEVARAQRMLGGRSSIGGRK